MYPFSKHSCFGVVIFSLETLVCQNILMLELYVRLETATYSVVPFSELYVHLQSDLLCQMASVCWRSENFDLKV